MLRKRFSIGDSQTKSRFSFVVPESEPHTSLNRSAFRDPAALPMLRHIAQELQAQGYKVTERRLGKACHGACTVTFPHVEISVVLLVQRRRGKIEFEVFTWPSQTLRQRVSGRAMKSADCREWMELCLAMHSILSDREQLGV
jgi:hypothetical protein